MNESPPYPEGIDHLNIHQARGPLHGWPVGMTALALLLAAALLGVFGAAARVTDVGNGIEAAVEGPVRIRNGEIFEMRVTVSAQRNIRDLVLLVDKNIWHDVTINTFIPSATEESVHDGAFEFHFGALEAGASLLVKVDGQINPSHPPVSNEGAIRLADGETVLATVGYKMDVLP